MADYTVTTDIDTFMQSADKAAMRTNMDLGTAATKDVAASGDAASGEVVKGDDTRLTDARTPTSHTHTASEVTDFDTEVANNTTVAANTSKLAGIEAGAEVNNISDVNATDLTDGGDSTLHYHAADRARANHTGTQTLSTISDAGTAASKDVPATGDAGAGEVVLGNDSRLTDARTPTSHTHTASEITDFDTEVSNNTTVAANTSKLSGIEAGAEVNNISDANATDLTDGGDSSLHYHSADRNRSNHTGTQTLSTISDAGTIASQDANSVNITGGSVTGITDLAIADGGTGAGTASGARTNLDVYSTGEVDEYLGPKATAGGVRFSTNGVLVLSDNSTRGAAFDQVGNVLTYSWIGNASQQTFRQYLYIKSNATNSSGGGFEIFHTENTTELAAFFRQSGVNTGHYGYKWSNVIDGTPKHYVLKVDYTGTDPVITLAINGVDAGAGTVSLSKTGTFDDSSAYYVRVGSIAVSDTRIYDGYIKDFTIFNRALSASEVTDLYRNGLAGIADADRWGGLTYASDFSATTDSFNAGNGTVTGNIDSIGGENDNLRYVANSTTGFKFTQRPSTLLNGITYKITYDVYILGTNSEIVGVGFIDPGSGTAATEASSKTTLTDQWVSLERNLTNTHPSSTTLSITGIDSGGSVSSFTAASNGDTFYVRNVQVTRIGAIAAYPMDEGIGYQLHDISSNHYDGLLSTSGFTHLVPKTEGYIRFSNLDIGNTTVDLLAAGRHILPENVVLRDAVLYNSNNATVLISTITIKRNNGTNFDGNIVYSDASTTNFYIGAGALPLFAAQQSLSRRRVELGSTDVDAIDVSGAINYQQINI